MTKKLILLLLALPLFLMIILFTATNTVSLAIDIPVSGIDVLGDETVYLDMDTNNPRLEIEYAIYPTNASNVGVSVSYNPIIVDGVQQPLAQFTCEINAEERVAYLTPVVAGMAEVVFTTDDGNHKDRLTVVVETRKLISIESTLPLENFVYDEELKMPKYAMVYGESFKISNNFNPSTASNLLVSYSSSDTSVVEVNQRGMVKAKGTGTAIITVTSRENKLISYQFAVEITNPENKSMVILEPNISVTDFYGYISLSVDKAVTNYKLKHTIVDAKDANGNSIAVENLANIFGIDCDEDGMLKSDNDKDYLFYFAPDFLGSITIDITMIKANGEEQTERCILNKVKETEDSGNDGIEIDFGGDIFDIKDMQTDALYFDVPNSSVYEFEVSTDNDNVIATVEEFDVDAFGVVYSSKKLGVSNITLTVKSKGTGEILATKTVKIVIKPASQILTDQISKGIEGSYTIGKYNADKDFTLYRHKLNYTIGNSIPGAGFMENIKWESNHPGVYVDRSGYIVFDDNTDVNAFVTFQAVFEHEGIRIVSQAVKIRCIANGYNVDSYEELLRINMLNKSLEEQGRYDETKIIVLQGNIDKDFGKVGGREISKEEGLYSEIHTTYDDTWYKNTNQLDKATVKILVEFRDDVYGNGYQINAENVVLKGTAYNEGRPIPGPDSLFKGPLYFVSLTQTGSSLASVAGQDNIVFAAYEGVTLNNIILMSMEMKQQEGTESQYNLQQLHYAGTTIEVLGDNVNIEYSRIKNGRNVIRAFGDIHDSEKDIHLTIKNSVLSEGRDFIMRIGSNCFVREDVKFQGLNVVSGNLSPYLENYLEEDYMKEYLAEGIDYSSRLEYNRGTLSEDEKEKYDDMYIKTFVTLRNSVLQNPGIFAIGMDSHFAGAALADGSVFSKYVEGTEALNSWKHLAKTSYGAKLTLEGDVRMYCWKDLETVDSSSLIEVAEGFTELGRLNLSNMKFDVKEMVKVATNDTRFKNIVYKNQVVDKDGKPKEVTWVHGGIAFFGGGKNYSVIDYSDYTYHDFREYEVTFNAIGRWELSLAAGDESFYFYIHDATTESFLPEEQNRLIKTKEGWECLDKN